MTHEFNKVREGIFFFLLLSIGWTTAFNRFEDNEIVNHKNTAPRARLGEICLNKPCEDNLLCSGSPLYICQCPPGHKPYNTECIPSAGENDSCTRSQDCCGHLLCINGICRKPGPSSEFVTLAKICLGITVTTIIIAIFSSLIKCLIGYDNSRGFHRHSPTSSFNCTVPRQVVNHTPRANPQPTIYDEKPPSYEECIRASGRSALLVQPPPFIISTNSITESIPTTHSINLPADNAQNTTTPLNVQSLSDINSNVIETQRSTESHPDAKNNSPLD